MQFPEKEWIQNCSEDSGLCGWKIPWCLFFSCQQQLELHLHICEVLNMWRGGGEFIVLNISLVLGWMVAFYRSVTVCVTLALWDFYQAAVKQKYMWLATGLALFLSFHVFHFSAISYGKAFSVWSFTYQLTSITHLLLLNVSGGE